MGFWLLMAPLGVSSSEVAMCRSFRRLPLPPSAHCTALRLSRGAANRLPRPTGAGRARRLPQLCLSASLTHKVVREEARYHGGQLSVIELSGLQHMPGRTLTLRVWRPQGHLKDHGAGGSRVRRLFVT